MLVVASADILHQLPGVLHIAAREGHLEGGAPLPHRDRWRNREREMGLQEIWREVEREGEGVSEGEGGRERERERERGREGERERERERAARFVDSPAARLS